jgi:hypothetical protein
MAATGSVTSEPYPLRRHAYANLAVLVAVLSGTSFVVATILYTFCVPITVDGNSAGCLLPDTGYGSVFLGLGVILLALSFILFGAAWLEAGAASAGEPSGASAYRPPPPGEPVASRTKCQYCGAWGDAGTTYCRRCHRPLSWSFPV